MSGLFEYNPTPWAAARCGGNWDINLPSEPDAKGVGVVATVFAGEAIARFLASAPQLADSALKLAQRTIEYVGERPEDDLYLECDEEMRALANEVLALLASVGRNPKGQDNEDWLGAEHEHAVGEAETPKEQQ